jgi:hypothetical protein
MNGFTADRTFKPEELNQIGDWLIEQGGTKPEV